MPNRGKGASDALPLAVTSKSAACDMVCSDGTAAKKEPRTPKQQAFRRRSRNAIIGSGAFALLYALAVDSLGREEEQEEESE